MELREKIELALLRLKVELNNPKTSAIKKEYVLEKIKLLQALQKKMNEKWINLNDYL